MGRFNSVFVCVMLVIATSSAGASERGQRRLVLDWPANWEHQPAVLHKSAWYLGARQIAGRDVVQTLQVVIIPANADIEPQSLQTLVKSLAAADRHASASLDEIRTESSIGYLYSTSESGAGDSLIAVEGVLNVDKHLVHFRLFTRAVDDPGCKAMLKSLASARIE